MARGDQLSRQWRIIQALMAAGRGKTAAELSTELECHSRTVYRDLEALQMAGFPLFTQTSDGKAYWSMTETGRRHLPIPLDLTELMALYFSRNMLKVLRGTAIHDSLTSLFEKVKATLPPAYIDYLSKVENSLEVGVKSYKPYRQFQETLAQVGRAAQERRSIEIDYYTMNRRELTHRRVAPYKLWFYDETFYLIGYCELRRAMRVFAVDRIATISVLEENFAAPPDFDAEAFMRKSFGVFQGDPVAVRIRFSPEAAGYVREKIWHPSQALTTLEDGGLLFSAEVAGIEEIKFWVLKWGAEATVLEPPALRRAVAGQAQAMLANYTAKRHPDMEPDNSRCSNDR
jgi:predicted DNA-binding transcriptional regulator YafY